MGKSYSQPFKITHLTVILLLTILHQAPITNSQSNGMYFSTLIGGRGADAALDTALNENDEIYLAGVSNYIQPDELTTSFIAPETTLTGDQNVFVNKYSNSGELISKFIIGGSNQDHLGSMLIDSEGNLIIVGSSYSKDFPTLNSEYAENTTSTRSSIFIMKVSPSQEVLWSTVFINASVYDNAPKLTIDSADNIIVTFSTYYKEFPIINGISPDPDIWTARNTVVFKLSPSGQILWSTYLYGKDTDLSSGITVDENNNIYVSGITYSTDFPGRNVEENDYPLLFIAKFSEDGLLIWVVIEKPIASPSGRSIAYDQSTQSLIVFGLGIDYDPLYLNPESASSIKWKPFLLKITIDGDILWKEFFGVWDTYMTDIIVSTDAIYISGAQRPNLGDENSDLSAFIYKFSSEGNLEKYGILGGSNDDYANAIEQDSQGRLILVGHTFSADFPLYNQIESNIINKDAFLTIIGEDFLKDSSTATPQRPISISLLPVLMVLVLPAIFRNKKFN